MFGSFFESLVPGDIVHVPDDLEYRVVIGVVKGNRFVRVTWYTITSARQSGQRSKFWSYDYILASDTFVPMMIFFAADRSPDV